VGRGSQLCSKIKLFKANNVGYLGDATACSCATPEWKVENYFCELFSSGAFNKNVNLCWNSTAAQSSGPQTGSLYGGSV